MAIELLVDEAKYREALEKLKTELTHLYDYKRNLQTEIGRMTGATFSGTSVESAIDKAKELMDATDLMIQRTEKQIASVEYQLTQSAITGATLDTDMKNIEIPDLFK